LTQHSIPKCWLRGARDTKTHFIRAISEKKEERQCVAGDGAIDNWKNKT
jgi:hypothetical protein